MALVGIKFLLKYGHFIQTRVSDEEVKKVFHIWRESLSSGKIGLFSGTDIMDDGQRMEWSIRADDVVGMHTFSIELARREAEQMVQQQYGQSIQVVGSGYIPTFNVGGK